MRLSPHFQLIEFTRSQTAARLGIDNSPSIEVVRNLKRLAYRLELIRLILDKPIFINSGYRAPKLNLAIGGAKRSDHMLGLAADFVVPDMTPKQIIQKIKLFVPHKKIIEEFGEWVHFAIENESTSNVLLAKRVNGQVQYERAA